MTYFTRIAIAVLVAAASAAAALAQGTGSEGYFQLYNNTSGNIVIGFYTDNGSGWSDNWLEGIEIAPGESATATFMADTGKCEQVFQVGWLGSNSTEILDDPISIDICAASNVYMDDNEIYFD